MALMECSECGKPVNSLSPENCEYCGAITRQESCQSKKKTNWKASVTSALGGFCLVLFFVEKPGPVRDFFLGAFLVLLFMTGLPEVYRQLVTDLKRASKRHRLGFVVTVVVGISLCICLYVYNLLNPSP